MPPFNQNTFSLAFGLQNINGALNTRTVTSSANIATTDNIIYVNASAPVTLTPPPTPAVDQFLIIKDIAGNAATDNITFAGTIDGTTNRVIGANYGGMVLTWNGATWSQHA